MMIKVTESVYNGSDTSFRTLYSLTTEDQGTTPVSELPNFFGKMMH